ncbi:MAG TPA: SpoIIE family protein phosphatase, partial [Flavobacteriales bacterium]
PVAGSIPHLRSSSCLWLPRDVVSGDFLWHYATDTHLFVAVADCTGHGVPGALMSMLGHNLLNQMVVERKLRDPGKVLAAMDRALVDLFSKYAGDERMNDGLDVGFITLERASLKLAFAGALIRCHVIRDGVLEQLECSRWPLGGHVWHQHKTFEVHEQQLRTGDRLVMHSDGYQSQFGGPKDRKINGRHLRELLARSSTRPPLDAVQFLHQEFMSWKGNNDQVDDVLVVIMDV